MAPGAAAGAGSGKFTAQLYDRGDPCGSVDRKTTVVFECDRNVTEPTLRGAVEVEVCSYELRIGMAEWCEAEAAGTAGVYARAKREQKE